MGRPRTRHLEPPNQSGLCGCGCGEITPVAIRTNTKAGQIAGEHIRYLLGHALKTKHCQDARRKTRALLPIGQVSHAALHSWIGRRYPLVGTCERCGKTGRTEYASTNGHRYVRPHTEAELRGAFAELCRSCHLRMDYPERNWT